MLNWLCCHSNLQWHWNDITFNLAFILHCTNKDSMKIEKIDFWLIKWFLKWCNVLILQNKILALQIVSPRDPLVTISGSVYYLWCCSWLTSYIKRYIVYFYLKYYDRIFLLCLIFLQFFYFVSLVLVNTYTINLF